jgi:uncharacterized membrane protein YfcA
MLQELLLFAVGIIVGIMNAIAGGGMLLGFPVLLAVGIPPLAANATSNIIILPGQISSLYGYRKYFKRIPKAYLMLYIPCTVGGIIGAFILRNTPSSNFERLVPGLIVFAVVLFIFQPFLHNHVHYHMHGPKKHQKRIQPVVLLSIAMFPLSMYGGYFGAGFGFIMLAFLGFTKVHEIHQMNALKNLMAICIALASIAVLYGAHIIDWKQGAVMGAGNFIGGYVGAMGAQRFSSHAIRIVVIVIGLSTAGYLLARAYL